MSILRKEDFIAEIDGKETALFTLRNKNGIEVAISNYGGKIVAIMVPDRNGNMADIVSGYANIEEYINGNKYFGAIIGRCGNRIAKGKFKLNGKDYQVSVNLGKDHLHGGFKSFSDVVWDARKEGDKLLFSYLSEDGEEGYPGNLSVTVEHWLTEDNELHIVFRAVTDADTVVNLTHHSFFNLKGHGNGNILDHELMINADYMTPVNEQVIPTGEIVPVENTAFDFRQFHTIAERIDDHDEQLKRGGGYDHNFVVNGNPHELRLAGILKEKSSGRILEVHSNAPGLQIYTGNGLDGSDTGKDGISYGRRSLVCLEPQHFPDAVNIPQFPSVVLKPGEEYHHHIVYKFRAE